MSTVFSYIFDGTGSLPASLQLDSGPAIGTNGISANPASQSRMSVQINGGIRPHTVVFQGGWSPSSGEFEVDAALQADGSRYVFLFNAGGQNAAFYHVSAANAYTQIGSTITGIVWLAWVRGSLTWDAGGVLTGSAWTATSKTDLGATFTRVVNAATVTDTGGVAGAPRITATTGKAGFLVRGVQSDSIIFTDASVSTSGDVSGAVTLDTLVASGVLSATALGSITTLPFSRNPGSGARPTGLLNNALAVLTDDPNLARLAGANGLTMDGSGRLTLSGAIPVPAGTSVIVVTREADGKLGVERYTVS